MLATQNLTAEQVEQLHALYKDLVKFYYDEVKGPIIASEREDKEGRFSIVAVIELRSAFDHMARAQTVMYDIATEENNVPEGIEAFTYCTKNLDKAHAHLYRAAYDAYDIIADRIIHDVDTRLSDISQGALYTVIPDASAKIYAPYDEGKKLVSRAKFKKDVGSKSEEETEFVLYQGATNKLQDARELLEANMLSILRVDEERKKEADERSKKDRSAKIRSVLVPLGTMLLGLLLSYIIYISRS
ncbi:MAG: hypothetical protein WC899_10630 [bacterium]|jgi:hypothetical protein